MAVFTFAMNMGHRISRFCDDHMETRPMSFMLGQLLIMLGDANLWVVRISFAAFTTKL